MAAPDTTKASVSVVRAADDPAPLFLGDAIGFFLDAKRAGGRGEKTIDDYRKKLDLFQRWLAGRAGPEEVRVARGKGNKERVVPMRAKLKKSLSRYLRVRADLVPAGAETPPEGVPHLLLNERGTRVSENTLRRRLYKWVGEANLQKKACLKPHDLRRTFGTWYLQENPGGMRELAELMGHSDLSQVMKYALSDAERARAGVGRL